MIEEQKTARAWAFAAPAPADPNAPSPPIVKPAVGGGQGANTGSGPQISQHDPSDVKFWFSNFDKISAAASERVARGEV